MPCVKVLLAQLVPKEINLFNWLAWKNKILTLENLTYKRFNRLSTATCVLCHTGIEFVNHLFFQCPLAEHVWNYFIRLFSAP